MTTSSQHDPVTRPAPRANTVTAIDAKTAANGQGNRRARLDPKLRHYPESRFGGYSDIDQLVVFYTRVRSLLEPSFTVLDIGCGRGKHAEKQTARTRLKILNDQCKTVIGIDVNPAAQDNPFVDQFHLIDANSRWPIPDSSVDLAVSDYVLEHVENPDLFFSECHRVIRPGGYLCMRTTNALSYFGVAARVIPNRLHPAIVQRAYVNPRKEEDVFPTRLPVQHRARGPPGAGPSRLPALRVRLPVRPGAFRFLPRLVFPRGIASAARAPGDPDRDLRLRTTAVSEPPAWRGRDGTGCARPAPAYTSQQVEPGG